MVATDNYATAGGTLRRVACCLGRTGRFETALAAVAAADAQPYTTPVAPDLAVQLTDLHAAARTAMSDAAVVASTARGQRGTVPDVIRALIVETDNALHASMAEGQE
jgi:hypothetical protein